MATKILNNQSTRTKNGKLPKGAASQITLAAGTLNALSNPQRLRILCHLVDEGELTVTALGNEIDLSQSALSQHLARLRKEGIVSTRKASQQVYYRIEREDIKRILILLHQIYCS